MVAAELTVASLNTLGIPRPGARLARRYAAIGAGFETGDADVACFQEVLTWWHLRLLIRAMPSFGQVSFRRTLQGPAGGLVTFSRLPVSETVYRGFGRPPRPRGGVRRLQHRQRQRPVQRLRPGYRPVGRVRRNLSPDVPRRVPPAGRD